MMRMMIMRMRMMRMMIMTKMMRSLHHISICQGGRWGCGGDGDYEEEDDGNHFWLAAMVDCGWWSPFLLHLSFDDTKFMAGKSMWRGGEFALRRKSQSSDAQKKTSCHRQSRRSQVRSTQRRGLFRTIIFSGKKSWPSCVLDQLHFKVKGYNAGIKANRYFPLVWKPLLAKKLIFFTTIAHDNFNYLFLGLFWLFMICLRFKPQAFPASEVPRLGASNSLFLLEGDLTSTSSRRAAETGEIFSSICLLHTSFTNQARDTFNAEIDLWKGVERVNQSDLVRSLVNPTWQVNPTAHFSLFIVPILEWSLSLSLTLIQRCGYYNMFTFTF